jgi:hypothetical protein
MLIVVFLSISVISELSHLIKWLGHKDDHQSPSSVMVKNVWTYTSLSSFILMVWYLLKHIFSISGAVSSWHGTCLSTEITLPLFLYQE